MRIPTLMVATLLATTTALAVDSLKVVKTYNLDEVQISGTRISLSERKAPRLVTVMNHQQIQQSGAFSVNDLLQQAVGIDCRQRGEMGVQTDISVRGGTFDQVSILLNGVNISSPHTGHLSADFPVSVEDIERIEVVEGPAARVFGTQAFTGVINIVTRQASTSDHKLHGSVSGFGGGYGTFGGHLSFNKSHALGENLSMGHALSGGYATSDGATSNSYFQNTQLFYQNHLQGKNYSVDAQLGYSYKPYGANTFYGAASQDQWESNERYMASVRAEVQTGIVHLSPNAYWNRWYDHYQWHRGKSPSGENYHQVDARGLGLNASVETRAGHTSLGFELRQEAIWSTNLGQAVDTVLWRKTGGHDRHEGLFYTKHDSRLNLSVFLEHNILLQDWTISLGLMGNYNNGLDNRFRVYPGLDVSYRPNNDWRLFLSYNMALRMPTFTDLYYRGAGYAGTATLRPERTQDVSLGAKYRRQGVGVEGQIFYSHKDDLIDWVVYQNDTLTPNDPNDRTTWTYRSGNFKLDNLGVELQAAWYPQEIWTRCPLRSLSLQYAYIHEDINYPDQILSSKYAMEYLRHKVVLQADVQIWKYLSLSASWRYLDRIGAANKPYNLLDARLCWNAPRWQVYVAGTNLTNTRYFDYSIVPQPGTEWRLGAAYRW